MDGGATIQRYLVRAARLSDVEAIAEIGAHAHAEMLPPFDGPINWEKSIRLVCDVIQHSVALVVTQGDGVVVATCGLRMVEHDWTDQRFLQDAWIAVHREHRTLPVFAALIRGISRAAEPIGVPVIVGNMTLTDENRKTLLFERYMKPLGRIFLVGVR